MALNIVTSVQPLSIQNLVVFIYGDPGIWKTSLAFTAKKPILFDFDKGAHRAGVYRKDTVQINHWGEVANFTAQDLNGYDTIIVDTAGRALDMITDAIKSDSKNTRRNGELSMQGYGKLGSIFSNWLKMLRGMGKDVVLLAHASEDKNGDEIIKRPDMVGGSKKEAYKIADMMGYMTIEQGNQGAVRMLNFRPHPNYLAKDSGNIGNVVVHPIDQAPNQLACIIQATKDHINSLSAEASKAQQDLDDLRTELMEVETANALNGLIDGLNTQHPLYKQMKCDIWTASKNLNVEFDKASGKFVDVVEAETAEVADA
ncbi:ATP-binding protein [Psychrobacter sp. I-STPA6b]|uniref:ATP-binding protein n=1 Tax=Psychrobacter sp. I-STPA6b TaxID=2585718 RepID=UPI001D0C71D1|nr:ATP-binding protein [Psychrobacter sp. I-STPA6b]